MSINTMEYAKVFQTELDRQVQAQATSGWMEGNAKLIKYNGGNEIKLPTLEMDGLADYDRDNGFARGSVNLTYQTLALTQDRGRTFQLDAMDVDETNFAASASNIMGEFQRTKVIPEIDAYRYSTIAKRCMDKERASGGYTPSSADILTKLREDMEKIYENAGEVELVITMSSAAAAALDGSSEFSQMVDVGNFKRGEFNCRVKMMNGNPIIRVPSDRMKTGYTFQDGVTEGQEKGGFVAAEDAKNINWIICAKTAPIAISKTDVVRIFDPMENQSQNAWKIDYRKYHDVFVPDNQCPAIWVNLKEALA
jgi:hypothetical protein